MQYRNEIDFLLCFFKKNHLRYATVSKEDLEGGKLDEMLGTLVDISSAILKRLTVLTEGTIYRFKDVYHCSYRILKLADELLVVGPFLENPISEEMIASIRDLLGLPFQRAVYLSEYYRALPILTEGAGVLTALDVFAERVWQTGRIIISDIFNTGGDVESPFSRTMLNIEPTDTLITMKAIERRYEYENELIRAVSLGKLDVQERFSAIFNDSLFEKRTSSPLRNAQNYCIIMNTLLRKAAENGGVHPIYLDRISSDFARKIEAFTDIREVSAFMKEMFTTYCRLVRNESMQNMSSLVKETVLIINADLSADISPHKLASSQGVSLGYLSVVFRREMGKTMSAYIRERRMGYAEYLLSKTELQIQTVALHCGIMDVQYFSKLFKRHFGKTPTEYREAKRLDSSS